MTNVRPDPDGGATMLDISTTASNVKQPWDDFTKAYGLWCECQSWKIDYEKPGDWQVQTEWHKQNGPTEALTYITDDASVPALAAVAQAKFTDGEWAPSGPPSDLFTIRIWKG